MFLIGSGLSFFFSILAFLKKNVNDKKIDYFIINLIIENIKYFFKSPYFIGSYYNNL